MEFSCSRNQSASIRLTNKKDGFRRLIFAEFQLFLKSLTEDAPNGVSLEAVGAPGEQLPDAVEAPAARGQVQRRAPGESAAGKRASARVNVAAFFFLSKKVRVLVFSQHRCGL
jgi:hypothetical protein